MIRKTNRCTLDLGFPIENSSHRQKCAGPFRRCRPIVNQATSDFLPLPRRPFPLSLFFLSFYLSFLLPIGRRPTSPPGYEILWEPKRFSRPEFSLLRSPMNLDRPIVERDILDFFFSESFFFFWYYFSQSRLEKSGVTGALDKIIFFFFELITEIWENNTAFYY